MTGMIKSVIAKPNVFLVFLYHGHENDIEASNEETEGENDRVCQCQA